MKSIECGPDMTPATGDVYVPQDVKRSFLNLPVRLLMAAGVIAYIQFGIDLKPGFACTGPACTPTAAATATATPTRTPTPNSIATRIVAEQTKVADLRVQVGGLRNLKEELDNLKRLQQESTSLQNQIDDTNRVIDLQAQRDALAVSNKLKQEIINLQNEIDALNGTPTRTSTATASPTNTITPTPTPTWTEEQRREAERAGFPTRTQTATKTSTPTSTPTKTPEGEGGGIKLPSLPNIPDGDKILIGGGILAALYTLRTRVPVINRIGVHIPGPHF